MSVDWIDYVIGCVANDMSVSIDIAREARYQYDKLRAAAAERDALQRTVTEQAARIAALEMQAAMLDDYAETIKAHEITIAELEAAVTVCADCGSQFTVMDASYLKCAMCRGVKRITAHHPAPAHPAPAPSPSEHDAALLDEWHERM